MLQKKICFPSYLRENRIFSCQLSYSWHYEQHALFFFIGSNTFFCVLTLHIRLSYHLEQVRIPSIGSTCFAHVEYIFRFAKKRFNLSLRLLFPECMYVCMSAMVRAAIRPPSSQSCE